MMTEKYPTKRWKCTYHECPEPRCVIEAFIGLDFSRSHVCLLCKDDTGGPWVENKDGEE